MLPNHIVRDPSLKLAEKGALLVLSGYADKDNQAWPATGTIAQALGVSERQARRILNALSERGYVQRDERHGPKGERLTTLYTLRFDRWGGASVSHRSDLSDPRSDLSDPPDTSDRAPRTPVSPEHNQLNNTSLKPPKPPRKRTRRFVPPTKAQCVEYANEKGWEAGFAAEFYDHFTADPDHQWIDSKGNRVRSWKQKMLTWSRFKDTTGGHTSTGYHRKNQAPPGAGDDYYLS